MRDVAVGVHQRRRSRLLETWCLMEYAEKGSLADALRVGRFKRGSTGFPELATVVACLQDIANGAPPGGLMPLPLSSLLL